ncbi:MAG: bifunctional folylpolyglutamate synthase/dihydrofolate synthase [Candidatus Rokubacteria bacterium]|nr:bifunctional folylpolyglutamate synthase/dihydrofolate synthase [Candidatus Rokubacteria bacterium]
MTYGEAVARLLGLRGGEVAGMRPGLARIRALLDALGQPERQFRIVQVGGTNGKGSIAAMLAAILTAAGHRTGLYTSPHLCSFRERIRVDGRPLAEADVADGVEALGTLVARLDATMFEAATALALDHFARRAVEIAVLEVGLGGRLDATTVGSPEVEIIARIDHDHQAQLGHTLAEIAAEKAHIIRSGIALSARQEPEVEQVLVRRAAAMAVPLAFEGRELRVSAAAPATLEGQRLDLSGPGWRLDDVRCALLGVFQPGNALVAAAAARALGAGERAIRAGLAAVRWPGRFQVLGRDPTLVLDGAHNPGGARALAASLRAHFPAQPLTLVIGISADKDQVGILEPLAGLASRLIVTASAHPRAASPEALARVAAGLNRPPGSTIQTAASAAEALALALSAPRTPTVCVAGSLFLIGEVLAQRPETPDILCGLERG